MEYILDQILWRAGLHRNDPYINWMKPDSDASDEEGSETSDLTESNITESKVSNMDEISRSHEIHSQLKSAKVGGGNDSEEEKKSEVKPTKEISTLNKVVDFDKIEFSDDEKAKGEDEDDDYDGDLGAYYDEEADYGDEDDY